MFSLNYFPIHLRSPDIIDSISMFIVGDFLPVLKF